MKTDMQRRSEPDFDVEGFLARPLTAREATNGPTVRPTWFLWEQRAFWIITGTWAKLPGRVRADPAIALVVDECDRATGVVRQVTARGEADIVPFDAPRGRRKLSRYLGTDETRWDPRFRRIVHDDPADSGAVWLRVSPATLTARDLSFSA
ncbi:Pyridoxamine 5'-phosphate oxidase [Saccharopolyspora antimicrobica]|uniref:Pyridoxamine 5'-phosphate oxidase n=1 Tax=Saccharopolyspora antimicrobica TaxID=455193 RepID=A0A1I4R737_9PSEU|nr:pyridoxamine 5'-phosphate oxidase family protein [Saccharopolyspora antimicrobica]RKT88136.1 pyridoxamine 5'-phosphate oxidase [Saccharopolyspora antimicrobica]SFM48104.1 Pyridoxamine 5'-phosphate oxidase [Saccharopolyspora antimicrobica]